MKILKKIYMTINIYHRDQNTYSYLYIYTQIDFSDKLEMQFEYVTGKLLP